MGALRIGCWKLMPRGARFKSFLNLVLRAFPPALVRVGACAVGADLPVALCHEVSIDVIRLVGRRRWT